ncbi:MAG: dihydrodipicolinate reductase [Thermodesulfobacteriota bacterium]
MKPISVMVNGLPGNMAALVARRVQSDNRFSLIPFSLTGPEIESDAQEISGTRVRLIRPGDRAELIGQLESFRPFLVVDYTHPTAVNGNADFYAANNLYFVMGTTGGDRNRLLEAVQKSSISAVIAPNMAKPIVAFQSMMADAAKRFPGVFSGYRLSITESHQKGKADTSGTAKAMVGYFNQMGISFTEADIRMIRDPSIQMKELGVPEAYIGGHGWHTYTLESPDGTVTLAFTHNINGRDVYVDGTMDALVFLNRKMEDGVKGQVFSMMDVLSGDGQF